ncbi:TcfC E-set like domain-containing protein [Halieaceae bacterium]|nr:TcfC E-set like domain-containing protein [Halieaceae bacterium]
MFFLLPVFAVGSPQNLATVATDNWVPPGFESLESPQETLVDVFYAGYFLVSVPARFSPGQITFLQVDPIIDLLNDLLAPEELRGLLGLPLSSNESLICRSKFSSDCGRLKTSTVGVIFDQSQLKVNLFLGPELLKVRTQDQIDFLRDSDGGLSILDDIALFASGSTTSSSSFNVRNSTIVGYRESRVRLLSNVTNAQGLTFDTFAFEREKNGLDYRAGIFRANAGGFVFMQNETFLGATFGSSLTTRADLEFSLGSKLTLFLDSRSLVQIFRDGRLLSSGYYDAGNQEVDASILPSGSYEVEMVITDIQGLTRTEKQFYSKSARLPPEDQSLFFAQVGKYAQPSSEQIAPELLGGSFFRAGLESRLSSTVAGRLGFSTDNESTMLEAGLFHQGLNYELQVTAAHDEYSVSAVELRGRYRYANGNITIYGRQIAGGDVSEGQLSQIGTELTQLNVSAGLNTQYGNFGLFVNYNETAQPQSFDQQESYGITWRSRSFLGLDSVSPQLEISSNGGQGLVLLNLTYRNRRGSVSNSANAQYKREALSNGTSLSELNGNASTSWSSDPLQPNTYRANLRADHQDTTSIESGFEASTNRGNGSLFASHNIDSGAWNYSGSLRTSFAATTASVGMGGREAASAGFLVSVEGEFDTNSDVEINVLVNGSRKATIGLNSQVFIAAAPYETYEIEFETVGASLARVEYKSRPLTLYLGNVVTVTANLEEIVVGLGRILKESGEPLSNALLKGVSGLAITDDNGYFQAEMSTTLKEFIVVKSSDKCLVALPELDAGESVAMFGSLTCRPL